MNGEQTYRLPNSNIPVVVEYEIDGEDVCFESASIDGEALDCTAILVPVDATKPTDLVSTVKIITLKEWFQRKLDNDAADILEYHEIQVKSDYDEHFNGRAFV